MDNPPGAAELAERLLGEGCLGYAPLDQGEPWRLLREDCGWRILLNAKLGRADMAHAIALAIVLWSTQGDPSLVLSAREREDVANRLLLPPPAMHLARLRGLSVEEIATRYVCPIRIVSARILDAEPKKSGTFRSLKAVG